MARLRHAALAVIAAALVVVALVGTAGAAETVSEEPYVMHGWLAKFESRGAYA